MKSGDMAQRRMYNQHLWGTSFETPEEVVRWFGALQAQDLPRRQVVPGPLATDGILREVFFNHAILLNGQLIG
jgi:hypothetical protein